MTLDRRFSFFQNSAHPTWMSIFTIEENQRPVVNWRKTQCSSRKQYTNYIYWKISYYQLIIHSGFKSFKSLIIGNTSSKIAPKKKIDKGTCKESGAPDVLFLTEIFCKLPWHGSALPSNWSLCTKVEQSKSPEA